MHTDVRSHSSHIGLSSSPADTNIGVPLMLFSLVFLLLFIIITAPPAHGQQTVPATARQAAAMPAFAAKLRHPPQPASPQIASRAVQPAEPRASYKNPRDRRAHNRNSGPLDTNEIYDNGPINGTTDAWTLNFGFVASDSFTVPSSGGTVSGLTFGAWTYAGDVLQSLEVSISSQPLGGGTIYSDQVINFTQSACSGNQYGYNVCTETSGNFTGVNLVAGTYWVNLQNAVVNDGDPVYWDENSGVGCQSQGCPSQADENSVGTVPSEAFTLLGSNGPPDCVQDTGPLKVIHNFTADEQSPFPGLAIDQTAKLYGTTSYAGDGQGLAYQLAPHGQGWIFTPLYRFLGVTGGRYPKPGNLGPEGALYGVADGGLPTCGDYGCGVVYRLRPSPTACLTALCSWIEEVLYRFTGTPDGASPNGSLIFDEAGNVYGTTIYGGDYGLGTVFELTPSATDWTEKVIYSFTGGNDDGYGPGSLLFGDDGNLYGITSVGRTGGGLIFELVHSGNSWTEMNIKSFSCDDFGIPCRPVLLQKDSRGFYGLYDYALCFPPGNCRYGDNFSRLFVMSHSDSGWQFTDLDDTANYYNPMYGIGDFGEDSFHDVAIDSGGNIYLTEGGDKYNCDQGERCHWGHVVKLLAPNQDQQIVGFSGDDFRDIEVDDSGKLYGTTGACGTSNGAVWQLSP